MEQQKHENQKKSHFRFRSDVFSGSGDIIKDTPSFKDTPLRNRNFSKKSENLLRKTNTIKKFKDLRIHPPFEIQKTVEQEGILNDIPGL